MDACVQGQALNPSRPGPLALKPCELIIKTTQLNDRLFYTYAIQCVYIANILAVLSCA